MAGQKNETRSSKTTIIRTQSIEKAHTYTLLYLNCTIEAFVGCLLWRIASWTLDKGTMGDAVAVKCAVSGRSPQKQLKIVLKVDKVS